MIKAVFVVVGFALIVQGFRSNTKLSFALCFLGGALVAYGVK